MSVSLCFFRNYSTIKIKSRSHWFILFRCWIISNPSKFKLILRLLRWIWSEGYSPSDYYCYYY